MIRMNARIGLSVCLGLASCTVSPEFSEVVQAGAAKCPEWLCGYNSPEIDGNGFHDLNVNSQGINRGTVGPQNEAGFSVSRFEKHGIPYTLRVTAGRIYGDDVQGGGPSIGGRDLIDTTIFLERQGQESYAIKVSDIGTMDFAFRHPDTIETYVLEYAWVSNGVPNPEWKNLCTGGVTPSPPEGEWWSTFGQHTRFSIVFEGDRIYAATKTMDPQPDPSWFNVGCAGHTISKLHLTGNTIASQGAAHHGHWAERQATYKMLTADYCGTGQPFTVAGQPLVWLGGNINYNSKPSSLEARWTEKGAACLDHPRMLSPYTAAGAKAFPNVWDAIRKGCGGRLPEPCLTSDVYDFGGALRISSNP
jgi:hypothetical protein